MRRVPLNKAITDTEIQVGGVQIGPQDAYHNTANNGLQGPEQPGRSKMARIVQPAQSRGARYLWPHGVQQSA
jgi:hypothetical protein